MWSTCLKYNPSIKIESTPKILNVMHATLSQARTERFFMAVLMIERINKTRFFLNVLINLFIYLFISFIN